ncbi:MAG: hypothetical protein KatS3mg102_1860 [Planctomycetota bacterium]|nr:MAG: hypothetical protein KatS3mg102_1860 [Planctomycetota bacterium]
MALAAVLPTYAFDRLPLRAWMAARNAGCPAAAADVTTLRLRGEVFHLDPARRAEGRRLHRYAQLRPGPAFIERLLAANPTGAIKLGPGVELAELPLAGERELEVIGEGRGLVQAVLWAGRLARQPGARTATRLPAGRSFSARPAPVPLAPLGRYLHAVDPAIERAGLLGALAAELGLGALHPRVALLSAERIHASPWLVPFEVLEAMPWGERRVGLALRALGAGRGRLEVKTRGFAEHASALARRLGRRLGEGGALLTLFVVRLERSPLAIIARRCRRPEAGLPAAGPC